MYSRFQVLQEEQTVKPFREELIYMSKVKLCNKLKGMWESDAEQLMSAETYEYSLQSTTQKSISAYAYSYSCIADIRRVLHSAG